MVPHKSIAYDLTLAADISPSKYAEQVARGGLVWGASVVTRIGMLEFGPYVQLESGYFERQNSQAVGLASGIAYRMRQGVHLDLLGTLSLHHYNGWGGSPTNGDASVDYPADPGAQATLPCAGARVRAFYVFSSSVRDHLALGLQIGFDQDLKHELVQYLGGYGNPEQTQVGGSRWTVGIVIGDAIELGSR